MLGQLGVVVTGCALEDQAGLDPGRTPSPGPEGARLVSMSGHGLFRPQGVPEDLLFFYDHLRKGGGVVRVDQSLLLYRYHPRAATHSILEYEAPRARSHGGGVRGAVRGHEGPARAWPGPRPSSARDYVRLHSREDFLH